MQGGGFVAGGIPGVYAEAVKVEAVIRGERGFVRAVDFASVVVRTEEKLRRLAHVTTIPSSVTLVRGARALLLAQPKDDSGKPITDVVLTWKATSPDVGQIDVTGSFRSGAPGFYEGGLQVTAEQTIGDEVISVTTAVDVTVMGSLTHVEIQPSIATIALGRTVHFRVTGTDENGLELQGLVVLWSVADKRVGVIDPFGNFTAGSAPGLYEGAILVEIRQSIPVRD